MPYWKRSFASDYRPTWSVLPCRVPQTTSWHSALSWFLVTAMQEDTSDLKAKGQLSVDLSRRNAHLIDSALRLIVPLFYLAVSLLSMSLAGNGPALQLFGGSDDATYYLTTGQAVSQGQDYTTGNAYVLVVAFFFAHFGSGTVLALRLLNVIGTVALLTIVLWLVRYFSSNNARATMQTEVLFLFYASLLYYSTWSLTRDVWIYVTYVASLAVIVRFAFIKRTGVSVVVGVLLIAALASLRPYAAASLIVGLLLWMLHRWIRYWPVFIAALITGFLAWFRFGANLVIPGLGMSMSDVLVYRQPAPGHSGGASDMNIPLSEGSVPKFLLGYIHSLVANAIGPLPGDIHGFSTLVVFLLESIPAVILLLILWRERKMLTWPHALLLWEAGTWFAFIALSNDNYGTACRLRVLGWLSIWIVVVSLLASRRRGQGLLAQRNVRYEVHEPNDRSRVNGSHDNPSPDCAWETQNASPNQRKRNGEQRYRHPPNEQAI